MIKKTEFSYERLALIEQQITAINNAINANESQNKASKQHIEMLKHKKIPQKYISNLFNASRELYTSNKFLIFAIGDIWLSPELSDNLTHLTQTNSDSLFITPQIQ